MRKIRAETSPDSNCADGRVLYRNKCNVNEHICLEDQVAAVEKYLKIESSYLIFENMTTKDLEIATEMFIYLNTCPGSMKPWFVFYKQLFEHETPQHIILTLNRILKDSKNSNNDIFKILAQKLLKRMTMSLLSTGTKNLTVEKHIERKVMFKRGV